MILSTKFASLHSLVNILIVVLMMLVLGRSLNPFNSLFFDGGNDETQAPRILQFAENIRHGELPPRMAPQLSFGMGYPLFNFYAPTAYWITTLIYFLFLDVVTALKASYLLAILLAFVGTYLFLKRHFVREAALLGAALYSTSLYLAVDIFVRTNLAETWFLMFAPFSLWLLTVNSSTKKPWFFGITALGLAFTLTAHNILSPIWAVVLLAYCFILPNFRKNIFVLLVGLLLSAYFFIPLVFESHLTHMTEVASLTRFQDHFLCPMQLWQSEWGYGGSNPGCTEDGISFMVGKPQLLLALSGVFVLLLRGLLFKKIKKSEVMLILFFLILTFGSLFLTTYLSAPLWNLFSPIARMVQFPWRLIALSLIGMSFLAAYFWHHFRIPGKILLTLGLILIILKLNGKYFTRPLIGVNDYMQRYVSSEHILTSTAFKAPEYLPKTANYALWQSYNLENKNSQALQLSEYNQPLAHASSQLILSNTGFSKRVRISEPQEITLNVLYFPYWHILVNGKTIIPQRFDPLGRPVLSLHEPSSILVYYRETQIERAGNWLSGITFASLIICLLYPILTKHRYYQTLLALVKRFL